MKPIFVIVTQFSLDFNRFFQMCKVKIPVKTRYSSLQCIFYAAAPCDGSACEAVELSSTGADAAVDCSAAF